MKLKTVEIEGVNYAVVSEDGKPIYEDNGKEIPFDAEHALGKINQLNTEAKNHRTRAEEMETQLSKFKGIEDPEKALKAIETLQNIDDKKLIDAGKVEEIKAAAVRAAEEQKSAAIKAKDDEYAPVVKERDELKTALHNELIGGNFARSKYVSEKIAVPPDMVQKYFGDNFKVEEGKISAYDPSGNKIYSKSRPGEPASFDEALETLVDNYPYRDSILKGRGQRGSESQGDGGGGSKKTLSRAEFDSLPHAQKSAKLSEGFTITD